MQTTVLEEKSDIDFNILVALRNKNYFYNELRRLIIYIIDF